MTREELVSKADECLDDMVNDHKKADVKRGYNRITGRTKSKSDVVRDGVSHLEFLNTIAQAKGWKDVWHEEEEVRLPNGHVE